MSKLRAWVVSIWSKTGKNASSYLSFLYLPSPTCLPLSLASLTEEMKQLEMGLGVEASSLGGLDLVEDGEESVFMPKPFAEYSGHKADLLDISWSKNFFLLSASMDKTVRLWHVSRIECLCIFQVDDWMNGICPFRNLGGYLHVHG